MSREQQIQELTEALSSLTSNIVLSDAVDSEASVNDGVAATPKAVKTAYDRASTAITNAATAKSTADNALSVANSKQNALGYTPVKSVNGVNADAAGNVAISIPPTPVVTQRYNSTLTSASSNNTVTISSLTAYKPVFIALMCTSNGGNFKLNVSSGTSANHTYSGRPQISLAYSGEVGLLWAVPIGTSITLQYSGTDSSKAVLLVYQ